MTSTIPCAGIIIMDSSLEKTILVKTKRGNYSFPKGKRNKGESYFECAVREFTEETGISENDISILEGVYIDGLSVRGNPNVRYYMAIMNDDIDTSSLVLKCFDPEELDTVEWFNIEDVFKVEGLLSERKETFKHALNVFNSLKEERNVTIFKKNDDWKGNFLKTK